MKIHNIYASLNGQTRKIALEVEKGCRNEGHTVETVDVCKCKQDDLLDLLSADITFIGSGVYTWLPGKQMLAWLDRHVAHARDNGLILPGSPRIPEKYVCVYCTYAGPHTGEAEAIPAVKYMGQLFDHVGITIAAEWTFPAAFVPQKMGELNRTGRLGNIEGRPDDHDLKAAGEMVTGFLRCF